MKVKGRKKNESQREEEMDELQCEGGKSIKVNKRKWRKGRE